VSDIGATALIPFKVNSKAGRSSVWNNAYHYFNLHREEFLRRYHRRSNVESTFSMIKRKFGDSVRAKNDLTMLNETLAKFVCHNIACLIRATEEFGIDPDFGCTKITLAAPKLTAI
jgi:transposase